jgi:hypothetical protein
VPRQTAVVGLEPRSVPNVVAFLHGDGDVTARRAVDAWSSCDAEAATDGGILDGGGIESVRSIWGVSAVSSPSVSSGPLNTAFIAFSASGAVYATVQAY